MSEDRLLHDLGHLAREDQEAENARLDERWDRLAAGTLTPEEEIELLALAETSPEAREAYEAFRPLGPEFQARVVQLIRDQGLPAAAEPATGKSKGKLLWWPQLATRLAGWGVATAAAAATLVTLLPRLAGWGVATAAAAVTLVMLLRPPLPGYTLAEISGGSSGMRGEETEAMDFAPGDQCKIALRPETPVTRAKSLKAQCFLRRGQKLRLLETQSHVDSNGFVELEGTIDRDLPTGAWTLWAVVGRRGKLPDPEELRSFSAGASVHRRDWAAVSANIRIRAPVTVPLLRSRGVFFLLLGIGAGCASPPALLPPEVEYAGCSKVLVSGPVCVVPLKRDLRLWVGAPPTARIEIEVDGTRLEVSGESIQDGRWFSLTKLPWERKLSRCSSMGGRPGL